MVFVCDCGKRFRAPEGTPPAGRRCPHCSGVLRLLDSPAPAVDVQIIVEQKRALRDELRVRDRQLRVAHAEIQRLRADNEKLRSELSKSSVPPTPAVTVAEAPVAAGGSSPWPSLELPSERTDVTSVPLIEELPDLSQAPQLPSDRLPLYGPGSE